MRLIKKRSKDFEKATLLYFTYLNKNLSYPFKQKTIFLMICYTNLFGDDNEIKKGNLFSFRLSDTQLYFCNRNHSIEKYKRKRYLFVFEQIYINHNIDQVKIKKTKL